MRGRPAENITKKMKYKLEFNDSIWHYDENKFPNGPYLVEIIDPKFDKLEKLYNKELNFVEVGEPLVEEHSC